MRMEALTNLYSSKTTKKRENIKEILPGESENLSKTEKIDQVSILEKIRQIPKLNDFLKTIAFSVGLQYGIVAVKPIIKDGMEITNEAMKANKYKIETTKYKEFNLEKFLDDDFIKNVAVVLSNSEIIENFCKEAVRLDSLPGYKRIKEGSVEKLIDANEKFNEVKEKLDEKQILETRDQISGTIILINEAKLELITHLKSKEYLEKLALEMNISEAAAKKHQSVRVFNVSNVFFDLKSSIEIYYISGGGAYYNDFSKEVVFPYDINLKSQKGRSYLYGAAIHELLHLSIDYEVGLSDQAKQILQESAIPKSSKIELVPPSLRTDDDYSYFTEPGEMIVRKQNLDLEMQKLGIKKYGEKFTDEHYSKLISIGKSLSISSRDLIKFVKPESFSKVMNELAENNNSKKTYHHSDWSYNNLSNQA